MSYDPGLIVTVDNRNSVIAALVQRGEPEAALHLASNVTLANVYHGPTIQDATSAAIIATMEAMARRLPAPPPMPHEQQLEHYRTALVIRIANLGHPIMLVGPAGCGKTTIGEHTSRALDLPFFITSTINDTHELIGFVDGHGLYHRTPFRNAYEHGGLWVADEIDAWDASALLTANSALANGYCAFPDDPRPVARHPDFRMIATANTYGTGADRVYVGRNELDAASLDRFATIDVDYDLQLERTFADGYDDWLEYVWSIRRAVHDKRIRHVVSTRAIQMGATALNAGLDWDDVCEIYLFKGMSRKDRDKVEP